MRLLLLLFVLMAVCQPRPIWAGTLAIEGQQAQDTSPGSKAPVLVGAVGKDTAPTAVTDTNATRLWADRNGRLHITGDSNMTPVNVSQGTAAAAGAPWACELSDGSAFYTGVKTGQLPSALVSSRLDVNVGNTPTVIANAGTNLNTSALALEAGNLATLAGAIKGEDSASANADPGVVIQVIPKSTPADTAGTDGDYAPLQESAGRLWTSAKIDTALPTGANTIGAVTQASGPWTVNLTQVGTNTVSTVATGVQKVGIADDGGTAFKSAANALNSTGAGLLASQAIAQFDDVSPTSITENQFGNLRMSANRSLYNTIRDAAGNERGANVNSSNQLSVSVDNSNVSANIAQINGVAPTMGNGASGTGVQRVTVASDSTGTLAATQSGTWTVQPGNTANTTAWKVDGSAVIQPVSGTVTANPSLPATSALSNVTVANSSTSVLASNSSRKAAYVYNDDASLDIYLKFGTSASTTSFTVKIPAGGYYELPQPVYTGALTGITASSSATARVTEITS